MGSTKWIKRAVAAVAVAVGTAGGARAGLLPTSVTVTPEAGNFRWAYAIVLPTDMKLQSGNYFTLYDFKGYVPGSATAPAGWTLSSSNTGATPALLVPGDDPAVPNLTWKYTGPTQVGQVGLGNFMAASTLGTGATDSFTALTNRASDGLADSNITTSTVPTGSVVPVGVPEPTTLAMAGLGLPLVGLVRRLRRNKKG